MSSVYNGVLAYIVFCAFLHGARSQVSVTNLAGGQYVSTTNLIYHSAFTKDVKAMRKALAEENYAAVRDIYEYGLNVFGQDEDGNPDLENIKSLQSLSTQETQFMTSEITFNVYSYGFLPLLHDFFDGDSVSKFADLTVEYLFNLGPDIYVRAIDASIVLNLWMAIVHVLNLSVDSCKEVYENKISSRVANPVEFIDIAAAYWIGVDVTPELNFAGELLYKIADEMSLRFNQNSDIASVNKMMIEHLNAMQQTSIVCSIEEQATQHLRILKDRIVQIMTIPLIQSLIHSIEIGDPVMAKMYAASIVPQILSCSPKIAQYFSDNFVWNEYSVDLKEEALANLGEMFSCLGISCDDVGDYFGRTLIQKCTQSKDYAGYRSASLDPLVKEASQIDVDISQMRALVSLGAYEAAFDLFQYGRNSYSKKNAEIFKIGAVSYHSLNAYSVPSTSFDLFDDFVSFHKTDTFAKDEMYSMLDKDGIFRHIPDEGRAVITSKFSQYVTTLFTALDYLHHSQNLCNEGETNGSMSFWDFAAATLIGSNADSGSHIDEEGFLMYRVLKEICKEYNTCYYVNGEDPRSLIFALSEGSVWIADGSCNEVEKWISHISSILQVSIIQSVFYYTNLLESRENRDWENVGSWYISILSICPFVNKLDDDLAQALYSFTKIILTENFDVSNQDYDSQNLMRRLKETVPKISSIDCSDIGEQEYIQGMCTESSFTTSSGPTKSNLIQSLNPSITQSISPTAKMSMNPTIRKVITKETPATILDLSSFGFDMNEIVRNTPDVLNLLNLGKDIDDIKNTDVVQDAQKIYSLGKNSIYTIQSLSYEKSTDMINERTYNLYRHFFHSLAGPDSMFDDENIDYYADAIVKDFFDLNQIDLAVEAMKIMHIWITITHYLEKTIFFCKESVTEESMMLGAFSLDTALALWTGTINESHPFGNLWYEMTEKIREKFERSVVNRDLIKLISKARADYFLNNHCVDDQDAWLRLRVLKNEIISKMTIPMIQYFIDYLANNSSDFVKLYTVTIAPLLSGCSQTSKDFLMQNAIFEEYDLGMRDDFIRHLQSVYTCLGITCEDVGNYKSFDLKCTDEPEIQEMVGFLPYVDVREAAKIDLDVLQMQMFVEVGAVETARDLYVNGHNSLNRNGYDSLFSFTKSDELKGPEQYEVFTRFYGKEDYLNTLIQDHLDKAKSNQTYEMSSQIISVFCQLMIMFMRPLRLLQSSLQLCKEENNFASLERWNQAAANIFGSIVRTTSTTVSTDEGTLIYSALNSACKMFNTCFHTDPNHERSIGKEMNLANEYAKTGDCAALEASLELIVSKMQSALVQNAIYSASLLKDDFNSDEFIQGFRIASGMAVIPLVAVGERLSAQKIQAMIDNPEQVDLDLIVHAFKRAVPIMLGLDCQDVGSLIKYGGFCVGDVILNEEENTNDGENRTSPKDNDISRESINDENTSDLSENNFPFNRYPLDLDAWELSKIAIDVERMKMSQNLSAAFQIYYEGSQFISLESLSVNATRLMYDETYFCAYRDALWNYVKGPAWYANTITEINFDISVAMGVESSIILNLWMYIIHVLNNAVRDCDSGESVFESLDVALSLWVGFDQEEGTSKGHLLYSITESIEEQFVTNAGQKEARANTKLISLFNEARSLLNADGTCSENDAASLRKNVHSIQSTMMIPLIQSLIHYLLEGDVSYTSLYAYSIVPMIYAHNLDAYRILEILFFGGDISDIQKATQALESSYNALGITCADIGSHLSSVSTCSDDFVSIAGFTPPNKARKQAQIDLDIYQIGILLSWGKIGGAHELYQRGRNSLDYLGNIQSLSDLLTENDVQEETIVDLFSGQGPWLDFSSNQLSDLSRKTFQTLITLNIVPQMFKDALDFCEDEEYLESSRKFGEIGAYLIGSLEGTQRGGSPDSVGVLFYSLAKQMCAGFGTCAPSGDAVANENILKTLEIALTRTSNGESCSDIAAIASNFTKNLLVPTIQGILHHTLLLEEEKALFTMNETALTNYTNWQALTPAYAFANGILPFITPSSAQTLRSNLIDPVRFGGEILPDGATEIYKVFQEEIEAMGINCEEIGEHAYGGLCESDFTNETFMNDDVNTLDLSETTSLSNGLYITTTNIGDRHKIAKDVEDMENALDSGDVDLAQSIYHEGLNAWKYDVNGKRTNEKWSLREYSVNAGKEMAEDPIYNTYRYALRDESGKFYGENVNMYADKFVIQTFTQGILAAEAVVVLNLWMVVVHKVYSAVSLCKSKMNGSSLEEGGVHVLDEAVAYWIGEDQMTGSAYEGHLLYALAEDMGSRFNQDDGGQSIVNKKVLRLFNEAKDQITFANTCTIHSRTHIKLKHIADELVSVMTIPLLQGLIFYMNKGSAQGAKLYAVAVIPLLAGCDPQKYERLKEMLISQDYQASMFNEIMSLIQQCYSCLGITCDDIGYYAAGVPLKCSDPLNPTPIAGYVPATDVREHAKLDLDILQIKILLDMEAYDAASDLYTMGKNSRDELTLYSLASQNYRENVPEYNLFRQYFDDSDYGDTIISRVIAGMDPYRDISLNMKSAIVVGTLKSMVMHMHVLSKMYESIENCLDEEYSFTYNPWDEAVASLIGSMEGPDENGNKSSPGQFLYGVSQLRCEEFGTCDSKGISKVKKRMLVLIYAGQSQFSVGQCDNLESTVKEMESLMLVPLIQSTLKYAVENEGLTFDSGAASIGSGFAYSRSILPLINNVDENAAGVLENNMNYVPVRGREPIYQGSASVVAAIRGAISNFDRIDCRDIGQINQMNVCKAGKDSSTSSTFDDDETDQAKLRQATIVAIKTAVSISAVLLMLFVGYFLWNRQDRREEINLENFDENDLRFNEVGSNSDEKIVMKGKKEVLAHMGVVT